MRRRLYFLLPDVSHAMMVVGELQAADIAPLQLHLKAGKGIDSSKLPVALQDISRDTEHLVERYLWNTNLVVFFLALAIFCLSLYMQWTVVAVIMVLFMLSTFLLGLWDTTLPEVKLAEFDDALSHHEILLMVDCHKEHIRRVEELVHLHNSGAVNGGVSWHYAPG